MVTINKLTEDFCLNSSAYDDALVMFHSYDLPTNQVFIETVGEWSDKKRELLQAYLQETFNSKVLVGRILTDDK